MKRVGSFEAKTYLSRLLREVESGETVEILRNGHAIARIVPVGVEAKSPREAMQRLLTSRATLGELSVQQLRDEGRR